MAPAKKRSRSEVWRTKTLSKAVDAELARLGEALRALRTDREWSLEKAAEKARIHPVSLSRIENGRSNVTIGTLVALARAYKIPMRRLFEK